MQTVTIPIRTHEDFGDSLSKLITIIAVINAVKDDRINLDFSEAKMLNPFFLGGLVCEIIRLQSLGKTFTLNHERNPDIHTYLKAIHFSTTFSVNEGKPLKENSLERYSYKTYIPIISFKTGTDTSVSLAREHILSAVSEVLKNQLRFSENQRMPLSYFLDELTNNINDHSGASNGYVFAQYYPKSSYLDLCICDGGQGIFGSFSNHPDFATKTEAEALLLAVTGGSTKDRPEARGFGVSSTRNMLVNGLKGQIFIWTGGVTFLQTVESQQIADISSSAFFQGTYIAIRLPTLTPGDFNFYNYTDI